MISCMIKKFLKQLDVDVPVIWPEIGRQKSTFNIQESLFSDSVPPTQRVVFFCFIYMYAQSTKH